MLKSALFGFVLACLSVVGLVAVFLFAPDMATTAVAIFGPLIVAGAGVAARSDPPGSGKRPPVSGLCVLLLVSLMSAGACTTTYTGQHAQVALKPLGAAGLTAALSVDSKVVCTINGEKATLAIHKATAERICKAFPELCVWK
jgi:hypothetical protein